MTLLAARMACGGSSARQLVSRKRRRQQWLGAGASPVCGRHRRDLHPGRAASEGDVRRRGEGGGRRRPGKSANPVRSLYNRHNRLERESLALRAPAGATRTSGAHRRRQDLEERLAACRVSPPEEITKYVRPSPWLALWPARGVIGDRGGAPAGRAWTGVAQSSGAAASRGEQRQRRLGWRPMGEKWRRTA